MGVSSIIYADKTAIREIDGKWYAFGYCVYSDSRPSQVFAIGADAPESGMYIARFCDEGIKDVATPQATKKAAAAKARRQITRWKENDQTGEYIGEV